MHLAGHQIARGFRGRPLNAQYSLCSALGDRYVVQDVQVQLPGAYWYHVKTDRGTFTVHATGGEVDGGNPKFFYSCKPLRIPDLKLGGTVWAGLPSHRWHLVRVVRIEERPPYYDVTYEYVYTQSKSVCRGLTFAALTIGGEPYFWACSSGLVFNPADIPALPCEVPALPCEDTRAEIIAKKVAGELPILAATTNMVVHGSEHSAKQPAQPFVHVRYATKPLRKIERRRSSCCDPYSTGADRRDGWD